MFLFCSPIQSRADARGHAPVAVAFALRDARKLVRGLRHELDEAERFRVADDVVHQLQQHGDPWRLKDDLPPPSTGHST
jgi:hypothetical protein